jgi:hypothetical protein
MAPGASDNGLFFGIQAKSGDGWLDTFFGKFCCSFLRVLTGIWQRRRK